MEGRRHFIKRVLATLSAVSLMEGLIPSAFGRLLAKVKKTLLPKSTKRESLINQNPAQLDATEVGITPLTDFGTMGLSDHKVELSSWKLEISGIGDKPLELDYSKIQGMFSIERKVLMICPGVFANIGLWKGVSIKTLIDEAEYNGNAAYVSLSGPSGSYAKTKRFPMEDIRSDRVFLAYQVNGQPLPQKHGFPLRVVAEDYYGYDWVKFVDRITLHDA